MRSRIIWFLIGSAVVALSVTAWELVRHIGRLGDIPLVALILFAPGYFVAAWAMQLGVPMVYVIGATLNGAIYASLAWAASKVPPHRKLLRTVIVVLPFLPIWGAFFYEEFLS